ncbi:hypothetical protein GA0074694_1397 [Micromonospora inyonensis]|uniref:Uncharacterized protein n=2 Tax=Micromonospora inyonensis TaxID=47866 RepID=A0A1C6RFC7_9ACTN|nr:hypothetical protein GA0074694_1397 [Micromonospora inyonensis]
MNVSDEAAALEAEMEQYPDERGEILLEAADAWRRAGRLDRAADLLSRLITDGGEDGCYAMVQLAEVRFEQGDIDEAHDVLDRLAHDAATNDGHCTLVAELLAERGDLRAALRWYDRAVARLSTDELRALSGPDGWTRMSSVMIRGRREVRRPGRRVPSRSGGQGPLQRDPSGGAHDRLAATAQLPMLVRIDSQVQKVLRPSGLSGALRRAARPSRRSPTCHRSCGGRGSRSPATVAVWFAR